MRKKINDISKQISDFVNNIEVVTKERVLELINSEFLSQLGNLEDLDTTSKDCIVNAINELLESRSSNLDDLVDRIEDIEIVINNVKQVLIDALIQNGIRENITIDDSWETIINYITWFNYYNYKDVNVYVFNVNANDTIVLQNDLRGDTFSGTVYTDWGDGTIDTNLSHTYTSAGTFTVKSKYSIVTTQSGSDANTRSRLIDIIDINKNITNAVSMFYKCSSLQIVDGTIWDTSNITNMKNMFSKCTSLTAVYMDTWDVSNIDSISNMFDGCTSLYY